GAPRHPLQRDRAGAFPFGWRAGEPVPRRADRGAHPPADSPEALRRGRGGRGALPVPALAGLRLGHGRVLRGRRRSVSAARDVGGGRTPLEGEAARERHVSPLPPRDHFLTEQANLASAELDRMSIADAFDVLNAEDAKVASAVRAAKPEIVRAIELV